MDDGTADGMGWAGGKGVVGIMRVKSWGGGLMGGYAWHDCWMK